MALNEEICIDESTSKRSQITGKLLITMPKLNVSNVLPIAKNHNKENCIKTNGNTEKFKESVNIHNIVIDESEIPPLI